MKICPTCQACYEDKDVACRHKGHKPPVIARPGTRVIDGKYRLDFLLGRGATGAVYRCTHTELNRPRAIKLLRPDFATADPHGRLRLRQEALTVCNFDHPNVVRIHDYGTNVIRTGKNGYSRSSDELYIVMELLEGETLKDFLRRQPRLSFLEAMDIASQIAAGLAEVHAQGVVHRDLKPANIMVVRDRQGRLLVKIVDFGAVKLVGQILGMPDLELTGQMFIGSPHYTSPESCKFQRLDGRSDIYCLGLILYEMLAGRKPFDAPDSLTLFNLHAYEPPPALVGVPKQLAEFIMRTLSKSPDDRPQSGTEFLAVLNTLKQSLGSASPSELDILSNDDESSDEDELTRVMRPVPDPSDPQPTSINITGQTRTLSKPSARTTVALIGLVVSVAMSLLIVVRFVRNSLADSSADERPDVSAPATSSDAKSSEGFITVTDVNIRKRPSGKSEKVGLAEKGSRVRVVGKYKKWRHIVVAEHARVKEDPASQDEGWIDSSVLTTATDDRN